MGVGKNLDLVIIGHVAYDQTVDCKGEMSPPFPSGAAYFSGLAASLFSKNVGLVSLVGEDYDMGLLTRLGIDVEGVRQVEDGRTARFCVIYNTPDSSAREFSAELNASASLSPADIPLSYLEARHFHIAAMPPWQQRPFVEFLREKSTARLSLDSIERYVCEEPKEVAEILRYADLVFLNRQEYGALRDNNLLHLLRDKEIILKMGSEGALYIPEFVPDGRKGEEALRVPAPHVEIIVDKSGSGDVLAGVFLALLLRGEEKEVALTEAVGLASKSLEGRGVEALLELHKSCSSKEAF